MILERKVMVCAACKQASCWHGDFYCQEAKTADIEPLTVLELHNLGRESPEYWFKNPATGEIDREALSEYLQVTGASRRAEMGKPQSEDAV